MGDEIYFYGGDYPEMFRIERESMDRDKKLIDYLNRHLPEGRILDIGAGNGFTARHIKGHRELYCLEPNEKMVDLSVRAVWVKGTCEEMPFFNEYFQGAYATWAYFLQGIEKTKGLQEVERVLKKNGIIIIADNYGNDEFTALSEQDITSDIEFYIKNGFGYEIINSFFKFQNMDDACKLLKFYFGERAIESNLKLEYSFNIIVYKKTIKL